MMSQCVTVTAEGDVSGNLDAVARWVAGARHAVALTGAGISVESGIPDFRSARGLWSVFDPMEYATYSCFMRTPEKSWELFRAIAGTLANKKPNAAHSALARLEKAGGLAAVITQNIDGLHQAAGSTHVLEIHGNHDNLHCPACGRVEPMLEQHLEPGPVPCCEGCDGPLKPTVVLFEEPVLALGPIRDVLATCDVLLVVGTSAEVAPASHFPIEVGLRGGRIIEMNIEPTRLLQIRGAGDGAIVEGPASVSLPRLVDRALALMDERVS